MVGFGQNSVSMSLPRRTGPQGTPIAWHWPVEEFAECSELSWCLSRDAERLRDFPGSFSCFLSPGLEAMPCGISLEWEAHWAHSHRWGQGPYHPGRAS